MLEIERCAAPDCENRIDLSGGWNVCSDHRPNRPKTMEEIAALAEECNLEKHDGGYRITHWTGAYIPIPIYHAPSDVFYPAPRVIDAQFAPRWMAQRTLNAYKAGMNPPIYDGDTSPEHRWVRR